MATSKIGLIKYLKILFIPHKGNNFRPRILERKSFYSIVAILICLKILSVFSYLGYLGADIFNQISKSDIYASVNDIRKTNGLTTLAVSSGLELSAQLKLSDMVQKGYFAHQSPDGLSPWYWFDKARYGYQTAGENLAMNFYSSAEVVSAWMNSPTHKQNILYGNFSEVGIAVGSGRINGVDTMIVVQHFGKPVTNNTGSNKSIVVSVKKETKQKPLPAPMVTPANVAGVEKENPISITQKSVEGQMEDKSNENGQATASKVRNGAYYSNLAIGDMLLAIGFLVFLALVLKIVIAINNQYPLLIARGIILLVLCATLIYFKDYQFLRDSVFLGNSSVIENTQAK